MRISIRELMAESGVTFDTSGTCGLASAITDHVCYAYTRGFLIHSDIEVAGGRLRALSTRDGLIVILSILTPALQEGKRISELIATLPKRFTARDRLKNFPIERSAGILRGFDTGSETADRQVIESCFGQLCGRVSAIDRTDGLRVTFANDEVMHLRPSGNAPEIRCYSEAGTDHRAREINTRALELLQMIGE